MSRSPSRDPSARSGRRAHRHKSWRADRPSRLFRNEISRGRRVRQSFRMPKVSGASLRASTVTQGWRRERLPRSQDPPHGKKDMQNQPHLGYRRSEPGPTVQGRASWARRDAGPPGPFPAPLRSCRPVPCLPQLTQSPKPTCLSPRSTITLGINCLRKPNERTIAAPTKSPVRLCRQLVAVRVLKDGTGCSPPVSPCQHCTLESLGTIR
jgi:hypothetical protein